MAIRLDTSATLGTINTPTTSGTYSYTCTGNNRILFVAVFNYQAGGGVDGVTGITYGGVALTKIGSSIQWGSTYFSNLWYLANPASGANNVVVTMSVNNNVCTSYAASYRGALSASPIDQNGTTTVASGTSISKALTTTVNREWAVAIVSTGIEVISAGANTTARVGDGTNAALLDSNGALPLGENTLSATTPSAGEIEMLMATFKPALQSTSFFNTLI